MSDHTLPPVAAALRAGDRDRYFATLVLTEPARTAVQALYAFNAEIASVRERARQPAAGEIRLQWWDDALAGEGHGDVLRHPVAGALLSAMRTYSLPAVPLRRLIAARRFDLYDDPMPDIGQFEGYAGETVSVLYQFAAMVLNGGQPVQPGDAAGHLGVAQALIGHVSAFGFNARLGRLFLPLSVFQANGVTEAEIFSGTDSEGLEEARSQLLDIASEHLEQARVATGALPVHLRPAFALLPILAAGRKLLDAVPPFAAPPPIPDWRKIAAMAWWTFRNGGAAPKPPTPRP